MTNTCFAEWLSYLGIGRREFARRLKIAENCVSMAIRQGKRQPEWIQRASLLLHVPPEILLNVSPDDERARQYMGRALLYAARDRLKSERERGD